MARNEPQGSPLRSHSISHAEAATAVIQTANPKQTEPAFVESFVPI
jgi:hypothetical protein